MGMCHCFQAELKPSSGILIKSSHATRPGDHDRGESQTCCFAWITHGSAHQPHGIHLRIHRRQNFPEHLAILMASGVWDSGAELLAGKPWKRGGPKHFKQTRPNLLGIRKRPEKYIYIYYSPFTWIRIDPGRTTERVLVAIGRLFTSGLIPCKIMNELQYLVASCS